MPQYRKTCKLCGKPLRRRAAFDYVKCLDCAYSRIIDRVESRLASENIVPGTEPLTSYDFGGDESVLSYDYLKDRIRRTKHTLIDIEHKKQYPYLDRLPNVEFIAADLLGSVVSLPPVHFIEARCLACARPPGEVLTMCRNIDNALINGGTFFVKVCFDNSQIAWVEEYFQARHYIPIRKTAYTIRMKKPN